MGWCCGHGAPIGVSRGGGWGGGGRSAPNGGTAAAPSGPPRLSAAPPQNILPISAALFSSERSNAEPQCPPRLCIQRLTAVTWSRMAAEALPVQTGRAADGMGWAVRCSEPRLMMALHIPEENRWGRGGN